MAKAVVNVMGEEYVEKGTGTQFSFPNGTTAEFEHLPEKTRAAMISAACSWLENRAQSAANSEVRKGLVNGTEVKPSSLPHSDVVKWQDDHAEEFAGMVDLQVGLLVEQAVAGTLEYGTRGGPKAAMTEEEISNKAAEMVLRTIFAKNGQPFPAGKGSPTRIAELVELYFSDRKTKGYPGGIMSGTVALFDEAKAGIIGGRKPSAAEAFADL